MVGSKNMNFVAQNNSRRARMLFANGRALALPIFFPSISSVKTNLAPHQYVEFLLSVGQPNFLVSAYDIHHSKRKMEIAKLLKDSRSTGKTTILLDSGNYESFWLKDYRWSEAHFYDVLKDDLSDYSFIYDNQSPPSDINQNVVAIVASALQSSSKSNSSTAIPIIHCDKNSLSRTVLNVIEQSNLPMISIPERILGNGLIERIQTLTELRKSINNHSDGYIMIHLLGTGNPMSLLLFSLAGADSFDGLEWCQTVVNTENKLLYHFQQRELVKDECAFCSDREVDYHVATLGHNLLFYNSWMKLIQEAIVKDTYVDLLATTLRKDVISSLEKIWK
jgi:queuine/archaeosine tRNA-ribosyltransferase